MNGVHFKLTGEGVTECVGGSMQTCCDPRLNYEQSLGYLPGSYEEQDGEVARNEEEERRFGVD
ncbi:hypothetical protein Glove_97g90 [Diversispora epigaea]|uniref:Phospho-2-dehydro-3-deoxyheptonate aldolase n=1 Tax=Diversispora epigaea TaxID=1348612 RepID=A0A397JEB7_9GLOM|nr:hypothetical protein Glove_97g90 [Diversispora epigaea]